MIVFYHYLLDAYFFSLTRDRKEVDSDGRGVKEELGGVKGEKAVIRVYCMKRNLFSINLFRKDHSP